MEQIISTITTPLSLAALGLLLGAGIVRLILRQKTSAIGEVIVKYGFWLAVVLSVLANLVFAYQKSLETDSVVTGVVQSDAGAYLPYAIVDIQGTARAITDDNGSFSIVIPRSSMNALLQFDVSLRGYEQRTVFVESTQRSVKITLPVKQLIVEEFLSISSNIAVGHYIGFPQVDLQITMSNPTYNEIAVTDIILTLTNQDANQKRTLFVQSVYLDTRMSYMQAFEPTRIQLDESRRAFHVFLEPSHEISRFEQYIKGLVASIGIADFRLDRHIISDDEAADLRQDMEDRWFWYPGQYQILFSCTAEGKRYQATGSFQLSESDVIAMKNISKYYASGFGLYFGSHLSFVKDARPALIADSNFVYGMDK